MIERDRHPLDAEERTPRRKVLAQTASGSFGANVAILALYVLEQFHDLPDPVAGAFVGVVIVACGFAGGYLTRSEP